MFELLFNGVGDAFSRLHWGTHFLVRKGDFVLAIDCPDSYRRALYQNNFEHRGQQLDVEHINAMILTHLHGDHVNGLEMTACYRRFSGAGNLTLHTSPEVIEDLWERRLWASLKVLWDGTTFWEQSLEAFIDLHELAWGKPTIIGPFSVTTRPTKHHLKAMAMKISDGQHTLGYSCDTAYDPELIEWLSGCDLIIHESSLGPAHTPLERLEALPKPLRDKLLVAHYPDEVLARQDQLQVTLATEGKRYVVGELAG